ncbi:alpha-1,2-fucosyltransferase [Cellulophaga baltica]|uniref:alpha-1,2-fucosyltransferase n=1 Tax=Cellulophaga baltica TaxID=76594 RepID=UPI0003F93745|nr:alpha-1,2-fucosyltransferase [Cellulophaga baltica]
MKVIQATGQTCNQFWIYSHHFAESIKTGEKILILAPDIALKDYPNLQEQTFIKFPFYSKTISRIFGYKKNIQILNKIFANKFSIKALKYLFKIIPKVTFIEGKMGQFTYKDSIKYTNEFKQIFKPTDTVIETVNTFLQNKNSAFDILVGIHIRRGDYISWNNGKFYYSDEEYSDIMMQMAQLFPNQRVSFLMCSNEKIKLENFNTHNTLIFERSSAAMDLYGLSMCDYILGPPSSYSSWAAFYGSKPFYFIMNPKNVISMEQFCNDKIDWPPSFY